MHDTLQRLFQFKAWANDELLTPWPSSAANPP